MNCQKLTAFIVCLFAFVLPFSGAQGDDHGNGSFDIVILNGRVMDPETDFDAARNVGIRDGRIVAITEDAIEGDETIDATDHVVSPGFIDTQHHGHGNLWGVRASLRDGVTSPMDLEYGNINSGDWYAAREGKWPVNYAAAASHELHRMRVLDGLTFEGGVDAGAVGLAGDALDKVLGFVIDGRDAQGAHIVLFGG